MISAKVVNMAPLFEKSHEFSRYSIQRSPDAASPSFENQPKIEGLQVIEATSNCDIPSQHQLKDEQISRISENERFDSI